MSSTVRGRIRSVHGQVAAFGAVALGSLGLAVTLRFLREPLFDGWVVERVADPTPATRDRVIAATSGAAMDSALVLDVEFARSCLELLAADATSDPTGSLLRMLVKAHPSLAAARLRRSLVVGSPAQRDACLERHAAILEVLRECAPAVRSEFVLNLRFVASRAERFGLAQAERARTILNQLAPEEFSAGLE